MSTTAAVQSPPHLRVFLRELYRRSKVLALTGWIHLVLLAGMLVPLASDSRQVMGINAWIKPSKFAISITIYVWTIAWLLEYLPPTRGKRIISWGISISMLAEIACIVTQAARGTTSHYNLSTPFDAAIFTAMGLGVVLNSVLVLSLLITFFRGRFEIDRPYLWSIRAGLAIFLVASAIGGAMVAHGSHSVGVKDGGPGLPIVNWSTTGGDLRIAHFLGLHALQLLPILGFLIGRYTRLTVSRQTTYVLALSGGYFVLVGLLYLEAMRGVPLLKL